ncbi:MAG TPA: alpha/beta hydrolase-fold protein [Thermoanaerobaculia bacterium]|jgi:esterase/lipase superfamily enzyme|nr:alpha/beta hydrolase-fold protein [Thermoanaerobaculia bacterium]
MDLQKNVDGWLSPILGQPMPIVSYGHWGHPLLLFPTAAADFLENERFGLVEAVSGQIAAGRVRVFSINSINNQAWMDSSLPVAEQARRQNLYALYVEQEVVPYIRNVCQTADLRIATTGASFGAFHAANTLFRRPDLFDGVIAMSGFYDLGPDYLHGYADDNAYFNNPAAYLPNLAGPFLDLLQTACRIQILTGQGDYEAPDASRRLAGILTQKGIPHTLDLWGYDIPHDWPSWRKMLPYAVDRMGW